jgi:hypothetical protein
MVKQIISSTIENMKTQPVAFSFVVLNVIFLIVVAFGFREVAKAVERKDRIISVFMEKCVGDKT